MERNPKKISTKAKILVDFSLKEMNTENGGVVTCYLEGNVVFQDKGGYAKRKVSKQHGWEWRMLDVVSHIYMQNWKRLYESYIDCFDFGVVSVQAEWPVFSIYTKKFNRYKKKLKDLVIKQIWKANNTKTNETKKKVIRILSHFWSIKSLKDLAIKQ